MDAGDFRTAVRYYGLLLTRAGGADVVPPDTLFRAAYAFRQVGDKASEDLMWQTARNRGIREIKLGDETRTVAELQDYLASIAPPADPVARQWNYFLGDASHTGRGDGGPAFMWRKWSESTAVSFLSFSDGSSGKSDFGAKVSDLFRKASESLTKVNQPVLSPQFPGAAYVTLKRRQEVSPDRLPHPRRHRRPRPGHRIAEGAFPHRRQPGMDDGQRPAERPQPVDAGLHRPGPAARHRLREHHHRHAQHRRRLRLHRRGPGRAQPPAYRFANGFPGQPQQNFGWPPEIVEAIKSNRLAAFDLSSGCSSVWLPEVFTDPKSELSDCFFLGPPLAVNGKLYVLSEKQQELRLICMENVKGNAPKTWKPKIDFVLPLGVSRDSKLEDDALRRVNAAHLSYGEGVLVCPTNLGYVIGIDLLQNSLLWAYPYRDKADAAALDTLPPGARRFPNGIIVGPNGQQIQPTLPQQGWKSSAPIIQDGKVVFTAYDSGAIHCVNLRDGSPVWRKPRQEGDLYLGGVVNGKAIVVGQKVVRAYNLSNGEKPWEAVETGQPSGFGAASDNVYYVPLQGFAGGKEPEICAIDVDHGVVIGHTKAHVPPPKPGDPYQDQKVEVPGNLIFFDGAIVSQSNDAVTAYPQMKVKVAEMNEKLAANPNDVEGLFDRGEMNLEQGDPHPGDTQWRTPSRTSAPCCTTPRRAASCRTRPRRSCITP